MLVLPSYEPVNVAELDHIHLVRKEQVWLELFSFGLIYFPLAQDPGQKFPADVSLMRIGKS